MCRAILAESGFLILWHNLVYFGVVAIILETTSISASRVITKSSGTKEWIVED